MGFLQIFYELSPEYNGKGLYIEEIVVFCLYPSCFVTGNDAACYDTMQVKMIQEFLVPCVEYGGKTYRASEVVPAELKKGLRYCLNPSSAVIS
jgi:hypothetical protein